MGDRTKPGPVDYTIEAALPDFMQAQEQTDPYSHRSTRIVPFAVSVTLSINMRGARYWRITVRGRLVRRGDHVLTQHRRSHSYTFDEHQLWARELLSDADLDPMIIEFAHDARRRIEAIEGAA